jgi:hypothetical protein
LGAGDQLLASKRGECQRNVGQRPGFSKNTLWDASSPREENTLAGMAVRIRGHCE